MKRSTAFQGPVMRWAFAGLVAIAGMLRAETAQAYPQETTLEPIVVVSVNSFAGMLSSFNVLGKAVNDNRYVDKVSAISKILTKNAEVIDLTKAAGIDQEKPFGSALYSDGTNVRQIGFLPVTDADAVLTWLKPFVGDVTKNDSGVYEIKSERLTAWAKVENGWMYWVLSPEHLDPLPDPLKAFDDVPGKFAFGVRVNLGKVPEELRSLVLDQLRTRLEAADAADDPANPLVAFRKETNAFAGRLLDRFAHDTEHVTFGANLVEASAQIKGQMIVKPVSGSSLATHFSELGTQTTRFGTLSAKEEKAILSMGMAGKLATEVVTDAKAEVEAYRSTIGALIDAAPELTSDADKQLFKDLSGSIIDAVQATLDKGHLDLAVRMSPAAGTPGNLNTLVAAAEISGGDKIVQQLDRLGEATKGDAGSGFKLEEATHEGVRISSFVLPEGPEMEALAKYFGKGSLYVGVNENTLYLAYGAKALDLIKEAITAKPEEGVPPLRVSGKAVVLSRITAPSGAEGQMALLMGMVQQQLARGDAFEVVGQTADGTLTVDFTMNKGFITLGAFVSPILARLILPSIDLNNPGSLLGF